MAGISVGVVVRLKSGGPSMTVSFVREGRATCEWFGANDGLPHSTTFPFETLVEVKE